MSRRPFSRSSPRDLTEENINIRAPWAESDNRERFEISPPLPPLPPWFRETCFCGRPPSRCPSKNVRPWLRLAYQAPQTPSAEAFWDRVPRADTPLFSNPSSPASTSQMFRFTGSQEPISGPRASPANSPAFQAFVGSEMLYPEDSIELMRGHPEDTLEQVKHDAELVCAAGKAHLLRIWRDEVERLLGKRETRDMDAARELVRVVSRRLAFALAGSMDRNRVSDRSADAPRARSSVAAPSPRRLPLRQRGRLPRRSRGSDIGSRAEEDDWVVVPNGPPADAPDPWL